MNATLKKACFGLGLSLSLAAATTNAANASDPQNAATNNDSSPTSKSTGQQNSLASDPSSKARSSNNVKPRHSDYSDDTAWFHDASVYYITDQDGDGFYPHFKVKFDADTAYEHQYVYAVLTLSDGSNEWVYYTTETFSLYGDSANDDYSVTTTLANGYLADAYEVGITLYDAYSNDPIAHLDGYHDSDLAQVFLEDTQHDTLYSESAYIHHFDMVLSGDNDSDGYYPSIDLSIDVDYPNASTSLYVQLEIQDPLLGWLSVFQSAPFLIHAISEADIQQFHIGLDLGYPAHSYPYRIKLVESGTQIQLFETQSTTQQALMLESSDYDRITSSPAPEQHEQPHYEDDHQSYSSGHGGSLGWGLLGLIPMALLRRRSSR